MDLVGFLLCADECVRVGERGLGQQAQVYVTMHDCAAFFDFPILLREKKMQVRVFL